MRNSTWWKRTQSTSLPLEAIVFLWKGEKLEASSRNTLRFPFIIMKDLLFSGKCSGKFFLASSLFLPLFVLATFFCLQTEFLSFHFYLAACHGTKLSLIRESKEMQCFSLQFTKARVPGSQHCAHWTLSFTKGSQNHGRLRSRRLKALRLSGWRSVTKRKKPQPIHETHLSIK